jgi:signal transduction histidine kinase
MRKITMIKRWKLSMTQFFRKRLAMSLLVGILTTILSGLGFLTSAFSSALILSQEIEKEVLSYQIERSQIMVQKARQSCQKEVMKNCIDLFLQHLESEGRYYKSLHSFILIGYPLVYLGGFEKKRGKLSRIQAQKYLNIFSETQISVFELGHLWSEVNEYILNDEFSSYGVNKTPSLQDHSAFFHLFSKKPLRFQSISIPTYLPDGSRIAVNIRLSLDDLQQKIQSKSRIIWLILGIQTIIISIFAFWLSHKYLVKPLTKLAELTHEEFDLKDVLPQALIQNAPVEIMHFQKNFLAMLDRLKQESHALAQAHLALTHQEGLATAGVISASIMHEIGNPLASVLGLLEFLQKNPQSVSEQPELLHIAYRELKRIEKIKRQLLDLAKPKAHVLQNVLISKVINWVQGMLRYQKIAEKIKIIMVDVDQVSVLADQEALKHALLNICMNASQALKGQGEILISVETQQIYPNHLRQSLSMVADQNTSKLQESLGVMIHIMDHGPGIHDAQKSKIFDLFTSSKKEQGNGLGLAIASLMIEECAGILWLNEEQDQLAQQINHSKFRSGACFSVWLPTAI